MTRIGGLEKCGKTIRELLDAEKKVNDVLIDVRVPPRVNVNKAIHGRYKNFWKVLKDSSDL